MANVSCKAKDCERPYHGKGYCSLHLARYRRTGQVENARPWIRDPEERLVAYTKRDDATGCLVWTGTVLANGYGYMSKTLAGTNAPHRYAWASANGPIPDGAWVDHICHNRACVEPSHLRLADAVENGANRAGANSNSSTGVRGVHRHKDGFRVRMSRRGKYFHGGVFSTLDEARAVAEKMRSDLFGAYAGKG